MNLKNILIIVFVILFAGVFLLSILSLLKKKRNIREKSGFSKEQISKIKEETYQLVNKNIKELEKYTSDNYPFKQKRLLKFLEIDGNRIFDIKKDGTLEMDNKFKEKNKEFEKVNNNFSDQSEFYNRVWDFIDYVNGYIIEFKNIYFSSFDNKEQYDKNIDWLNNKIKNSTSRLRYTDFMLEYIKMSEKYYSSIKDYSLSKNYNPADVALVLFEY